MKEVREYGGRGGRSWEGWEAALTTVFQAFVAPHGALVQFSELHLHVMEFVDMITGVGKMSAAPGKNLQVRVSSVPR